MKKYLIYPLFAASFTLASCNEDFNEEIASPQQWEQEAAITLSGFNATGTTNIDLGKVTTDSVNIISITAPNGMPKDTNLDNFRINLTQEAPGNTTVTIHADNNGNVATKDLQSAIETIYGKRPVLRTFNAEISANMMMNGQASLLSATTTITATPKAPFISEAYYLVGGMSGWSTAEAIKFSHSGKDVYEDPIFTLIFTAGDECWWKIISQSNMDAGSIDVEGVIGVKNGDTSLSGKLISENPGAGKIEEAGKYVMTIDMLNYTYTIEKAPEFENMYITGSQYGWGWDNGAQPFVPVYGAEGTFWSIQYLAAGTEFKFCPDASWSGREFGYSEEWIDAASIELAGLSESGGNIKAANAGWYTIYITINATSKSVKFYNANVYLIGDTMGAWDANMEKAKFEVPATGDGEFVSPAFENAAEVREAVCADMDFFGIKIDNELNATIHGKLTKLSTPDSKVEVWVVPTNEELLIARDTLALISK